jgi:hypothetical protein
MNEVYAEVEAAQQRVDRLRLWNQPQLIGAETDSRDANSAPT